MCEMKAEESNTGWKGLKNKGEGKKWEGEPEFRLNRDIWKLAYFVALRASEWR